jgi:hypothetical protein
LLTIATAVISNLQTRANEDIDQKAHQHTEIDKYICPSNIPFVRHIQKWHAPIQRLFKEMFVREKSIKAKFGAFLGNESNLEKFELALICDVQAQTTQEGYPDWKSDKNSQRISNTTRITI